MLEKILLTKIEELANFQMPERVEGLTRVSFYEALSRPRRQLGLIAEVKKASPSKGVFKETLDPEEVGGHYERGGADAISVLTDRSYFQGSHENLIRVKKTVKRPVLRKDFIIDQRQIEESDRIGADAILLIAAALEPNQLHEFYQEAVERGMDSLVEVHNEEELESVLTVFSPKIIGINNRNLKTFETSLKVTERVLPMVPDSSLVISESGVLTPDDVQFLISKHVNGALVGEALMRAETPELGIEQLFGEVTVS
ncbi:indole-3-glycerol phosphate synthase TrpC [Pullulanibacillus sp. KACC 23026]|uniref:indole-3-glycerol phosphate synthase TrpC n=1 Tax=Pullulanibacillus sp. KACC 23026 TaxID=3028315 RepID=UPI0023B05A0D|nr:indole-3-glycerol phosphate synthase TrpC [Pullulanibacillus sp. KACC 23026]WEG11368.1 indole-3-glycerol phosphate synthase TrpC [Pullulanibacillus sp. KACC 23026]